MYMNYDSYYYEPETEPQEEEDEFDGVVLEDCSVSNKSTTCSQGHSSTLILQTNEGGSICLVCFSNLISNANSPTLHVSYALSQLSQALSSKPPHFLQSLITFHPLFLISPLVQALSSFDDFPIASQLLDLISLFCSNSSDNHSHVLAEFVSRVSGYLSTGALAWSRRQVYMIHCLGALLTSDKNANSFAHIEDKYGLISNLVAGLQLPSEEIRGEILFVLYRISVIQCASEDSDEADILMAFCPKLLRLTLEALTKTQNDDVRLNCVALLTVLAGRGFLGSSYADDTVCVNSCEADSFMKATEDEIDVPPLYMSFSEAIKAPLLSADRQVQISTIDLLFSYMSSESTSAKVIQVLVEENIADYIFEILRLSECSDPLVNSCIRVLDLLSAAEQAFKQRLVVGFATLVSILNYVAEIPLHPVQSQTLKLIWTCVSDCPGVVSVSVVRELVVVLTMMIQKHADGNMGMLPDTFVMVCSVLVSLIKCPSSHGTLGLATPFKEASEHAVLACLSDSEKNSSKTLHSLYLVKEAYIYSHEGNSSDSGNIELRCSILDLCTTNLLPWIVTTFNEMEEEIVLGVFEIFHSILLEDTHTRPTTFAETLVLSSWFSVAFGCLGLFPTEKMRCRVYLMLSSLLDVILGNDTGQPLRDAISHLPSDPIDFLFLLGEKSSLNQGLSSCQSSILTILFTSSLYDERIADDKLVLSSLEKYILVNCGDFQRKLTDSSLVMRLVHLYGLYRGLAKMNYQIPYSSEAERILFKLLDEHEWDLSTARIHPISLKWLFQQDKICKPLSDQILKICRSNTSIVSNGNNSSYVNVKAIAQLVAAGDNFAATVLVCLLMQLLKEEFREEEIISLLALMNTIISIFPAASDQLCVHSMGNVIRIFYYESIYMLSLQVSRAMLVFTFNILCLAKSEILSDNETWLPLTTKFIDYFIPIKAAERWTQDHSLAIGILCLILHHSANNTLLEASKSIVFNSSLGLMIKSTIDAACLKGPALDGHDVWKSTELLICVLLLNYFSIRSLHVILPGIVDWQHFIDPPDRIQPLSYIGICCHDLCRLMHFGPPLVKHVASYCLLELLTRISEQKNRRNEKMKCTIDYLMSLMAVLEGLIFYGDLRVAINCGLCLSMILGWEMLDMQDMQDTSVIENSGWSRLIVEELAVSMAVPCLSSESFINHHKPAMYVAVALLRLQKFPAWMKSAFDDSCISGMIENVHANNIGAEFISLLRGLLTSDLLKAEQITRLNHMLQACRKYIYAETCQVKGADRHTNKALTLQYDTGEVLDCLVYLMSSESYQDKNSPGLHFGNNNLLEEIEMLRTSIVENKR